MSGKRLSDAQKTERRARAAFAVVAGIPTTTLLRLAALSDRSLRLAALAAQARKRALA